MANAAWLAVGLGEGASELLLSDLVEFSAALMQAVADGESRQAAYTEDLASKVSGFALAVQPVEVSEAAGLVDVLRQGNPTESKPTKPRQPGAVDDVGPPIGPPGPKDETPCVVLCCEIFLMNPEAYLRLWAWMIGSGKGSKIDKT